MSRLFGLSLVALGLLMSVRAHAQERPSDLDAQVQEFERRTGIDLHLAGDRREPDLPVNADHDAVDPALVARMLPVIQQVMLEYPTTVRGVLLKDMYLYGALRMAGKPFLGAARPEQDRFDLAIRARTTADGLRVTLYHEMSHLIEMDERFPASAWVALSKPYSGPVMNHPETKSRDQESWYRDGFVSRYASGSRHEDFAEMAEIAFTNPDRMNGLADQYPLLQRKLDMLTDVYRSYAPGMELPWTDGSDAVAVRSGSQPPPTSPPPASPPPASPPPAGADEPAGGGRHRGRGGDRPLDDNGNPVRGNNS